MGRPGKKHVRLGIGAPQSRSLFEEPESGTPSGDDLLVPVLPSGFDCNDPEGSYTRVVSPAHRKRLGQVFTPQPIADLLCRWVAQIQPLTMLDPAAGTGILVRTFHRLCGDCRIAAIEVDPLAAEALSRVAETSWKDGISCRDFLTWQEGDRFDAIVANPPYLRHHDICYPRWVWRQIERSSGVQLSRLANAYVLFILEICRRLSAGGRAGVVVPGEWLNANFGAPVKEFLLRGAWLRQLVYFSHAETLFDDALTTACLLLIERPRIAECSYRLRTHFVSSSTAISDVQRIVLAEATVENGVIQRSFSPDELLAHSKWNAVLENGLPSSMPGFVALEELAETRRGIATGANSFFHLGRSEALAIGLEEHHLKPCIGRARDVVGYIFDSADFARLVEDDAATHLFSAEHELSPDERDYIAEGERTGLPERYLLSKRSPWYTMERREPAPIWAAVFGRGELRFVCNQAGILNLTTFHAIYPRLNDTALVMALTACLNSRVVQQQASLQQRVYGGGLLKFEPRDLLEIRVPDLRVVSAETIDLLAECLGILDKARRDEDEDRRSEALSRLNGAVLVAAQEAADRSSRAMLERQSELGPLWAQHTHRDDPSS